MKCSTCHSVPLYNSRNRVCVTLFRKCLKCLNPNKQQTAEIERVFNAQIRTASTRLALMDRGDE